MNSGDAYAKKNILAILDCGTAGVRTAGGLFCKQLFDFAFQC